MNYDKIELLMAKLSSSNLSQPASEPNAEEQAEFLDLLNADPQRVHERGIVFDWTLLYQAANRGQLWIAKMLIAYGSEINALDDQGDTPLHRAAFAGFPDIVAVLLENGADPNIANDSLFTPLMHADQGFGRVEISEKTTRLLLEYGAKTNLRDWQGNIALHYSSTLQVARLLLEYHAEVDARNNNGETPLLWAIKYGKEAISKLLITHGANIDIPGENGRTLLHLAVREDETGVKRTAKMLIKMGANIEARDVGGRTPLHQAAACHYFPGVKLLLAQGANINATDNQDMTPLALVDMGYYLGTNPYYCPPPRGEGSPKIFARQRQKMAKLLKEAGGIT